LVEVVPSNFALESRALLDAEAYAAYLGTLLAK
jgi:hypothetical protein